MFSSISRIIKLAGQGFWRNIWLSLVTVFVIFLAFFSVTVLINLNIIADNSLQTIKEKVNLSLYFKPEIKQEEVLKIKNELSNISEIKDISFISRDQALAQLQKKQQGNPLISEAIEELEENPLGDSLIIKANKIEDYKEIISYLSRSEYLEKVWNEEFDENYQMMITKLENITSQIGKIGMFITLIFIVIAFLVIFNTIRIGIYTHREEIGIMKLVGATNSFVRGPFLLETAFYIILAWLINLALFFPLAKAIQPHLVNFIGDSQFSLFQHYQTHFWSVFGWQLLLVLILGWLSSLMAMRRYLKV